MRLILSRAHEVVQMNPPDQHLLVCIRCGMIGRVNDLFGPRRCHPALYSDQSGWRDEATAEERKKLDDL
jgi:hypothetical protein